MYMVHAMSKLKGCGWGCVRSIKLRRVRFCNKRKPNDAQQNHGVKRLGGKGEDGESDESKGQKRGEVGGRGMQGDHYASTLPG